MQAPKLLTKKEKLVETPVPNVIVKGSVRNGTAYYFNPPKDIRHMDVIQHQLIGYNYHQARAEGIRLNRLVKEIREGRFNADDKRYGSLDNLADLFFESYQFTSKAYNTQRAYRAAYARARKQLVDTPPDRKKAIGAVKQTFGTLMCEEVNAKVADDLYAAMLKEYKNNPSGPNLSLRVISRIWNCGRRWDYPGTNVNPFNGVEQVKAEKRTTTWTRHEADAFVLKAEGLGLHGLALGFRISYWLGVRPSDLIRLTFGNMKRGHEDKDYVLDFIQKKTKERVILPLPSHLAASLAYAKQISARVGAVQDRQFIVSPRRNGEYLYKYNYDNFHKDFERVKKECRLREELQFRDLRRTAITDLHGTDDEKKGLSGHKSRAMLDVYSVPNYTLIKEAVNKRLERVRAESNKGLHV